MSTKFGVVLEVIIDGIIAFTDYFIVRKHITLSEGILFGIGAARGFWPLIFGPSPLAGIGVLTSAPVAIGFAILTVLHAASFFVADLRFRIGAIGAASAVWLIQAVLVGEQAFASLAVPIFIVYSGAGAFIVVRLIKDKQAQTETV